MRRAEKVSGLRSVVRGQKNWLRGNWVLLTVTALSVVVLCFWQFRWTEWAPARRAFSAANVNDFSWRNRINAWEGGLQMMAEHPWLGVGWNQTERLYEHYYLPSKLTDSAAIQMNDYLTLGATIGVPGLVCLCVYLWLSLTRNSKFKTNNLEIGDRQDAYPTLNWTRLACRSAAIVLAVGFWFDGGLFKLPTAATFWILLELGRADVHRGNAETQSESSEESTSNVAGETPALPK